MCVLHFLLFFRVREKRIDLQRCYRFTKILQKRTNLIDSFLEIFEEEISIQWTNYYFFHFFSNYWLEPSIHLRLRWSLFNVFLIVFWYIISQQVQITLYHNSKGWGVYFWNIFFEKIQRQFLSQSHIKFQRC